LHKHLKEHYKQRCSFRISDNYQWGLLIQSPYNSNNKINVKMAYPSNSQNNESAQNFARGRVAMMLEANGKGNALRQLGSQDANDLRRDVGIGKVSAMGLPSENVT